MAISVDWTTRQSKNKEMKFSNTILLIALSACSIVAYAQDQEISNSDRVLEEIIVTASKREVSLQELPMSVAVLTGKQLSEIGALELEDFWRLIPSLNVRDAAFGGNSVIIRGLSDTDSFQSTESLTAFYLDDTAVTYVTGLFSSPGDAAMVDVSRVEILRGPQGTLVGANAMGGAIRVISNEPDPATVFKELDLNLSSTAQGSLNYGGSYIHNQPIGVDSAIRLAIFSQFDDGFVDDIGLGRKNINNQERKGIRFSWLRDITKTFEVLARVYAEDIESDGNNYTDPFGKPELNLVTQGDYQIALLSPEPRKEELRLATLRLRWIHDWGEFYSATSWFEKSLNQHYDWSKEFRFRFFGFYNQAPFLTSSEQRDFSQEFRVSSSDQGKINWLAGFYYLDQDFHRMDHGSTPGALTACPPCGALIPADEVILNVLEDSNRQDMALFGEVGWRFNDKLHGTIGGRWHKIDRRYDTTGFFAVFPLDDGINGDADNFVPKVSLSWEASEEIMVYGLVSKGFRAGQFNNAASRAVCGAREIIDSDELVNYEAGIKARFAQDRASVNATVFHIDWKDIQTNVFDSNCGFTFLENAGAATSDGLELDFNWLVSQDFSLQGGFGYNKAELSTDLPNPAVNAPAGTRIPNVPKWTSNLAGNWGFNWSDKTTGFVRADAQYVGSRTTRFDQSPMGPVFSSVSSLDSYLLVNFRIGANIGQWRTELFVRNVFDETADIFCCRFDFETTIARPRTIGVRTSSIFD